MHGVLVACHDLIHLGELVLGRGLADPEAIGFAGPAFPGGLVDPGTKIRLYLDQTGPLGGIGTQQRATDAAVLVDASGGIGTSTGT